MKEEGFVREEMRRIGFKFRILRSIRDPKGTNPYTLWKELEKKSYFVRFGKKGNLKSEIYNMINSLEKSGHIKSIQKIENGRLKNYYTLTAKGRKVLLSAKGIFKKHFNELDALLEG